MQGWILLHRKIFENKLWYSEKFTRAQAWIYILLITNYQDSTLFVRGNEVPVKRGQFAYSEETLAEKWKWSREKVRNFLNWLEKEKQIKQHKNRIKSVYTIVNYDMYQKSLTPDQTTENQQESNKSNNGKSHKTIVNKRKKGNKYMGNSFSEINNSEYPSLESVTDEVVAQLAKEYDETPEFVRQQREALRLYCKSKCMEYEDYKAALEIFIRNKKDTQNRNTGKNASGDEQEGYTEDYFLTEMFKQQAKRHGTTFEQEKAKYEEEQRGIQKAKAEGRLGQQNY